MTLRLRNAADRPCHEPDGKATTVTAATGRTGRTAGRRLLFVTVAAACLAAVPALSSAQASGTASVSLGPRSGPAGTVTLATGQGFEALTAGQLTLVDRTGPVHYSPSGDVSVSAVSYAARQLATFRTDVVGGFSAAVTIPSGSSGDLVIVAATAGRSASSSFTVMAPVSSPVMPPATRSAPPPGGGYHSLTPVGRWSSLPSDAEAAAMVIRSTWEPRPQNAEANATVPSGLALGQHGGVAPIWNDWLLPRVTGRFTGTTDEIVQWAAAKWGLPDELLRAQMVSESYWHQGLLDSNGQPVNNKGFGDYTTDQSRCAPGYTAPCPLSFGVLQIKHASYHPGTFPHSRDSTAFNADYLGAVLRGCYEGWETWLGTANGQPTGYAAGDIYGCVGRWYAGRWHDDAATSYISSVKKHLGAKPWLGSSF